MIGVGIEGAGKDSSREVEQGREARGSCEYDRSRGSGDEAIRWRVCSELHNVQVSTDAKEKVIVAVGVSQSGTDYGELVGAEARVEENLWKRI